MALGASPQRLRRCPKMLSCIFVEREPHPGLPITQNKKGPKWTLLVLAEGQGFEPWVPFDTLVFKTSAFDHSATPPVRPKYERNEVTCQIEREGEGW